MSMMKSVCSRLSIVFLSLLLIGDLQAATYQHSLTIDKMTFDWSVDGESLAIKISAPTTGWVGIGFNPTDDMKDANIILGFVKDGKVEISNEFGTQPTLHVPNTKVGGKDNVTIIGGSETGNTTTLEFSIPLRSGDPKDGVIDPKANTAVILAYGPERKSLKLKHQYAKKITVNLGSGSMK
jgi:DOMON domain